ncbi:hypothetical protein DRP07_03745 [Archaeoglobales archaeon]|nr:MAG: hypothetical protein DRP07_03745 [Archaeoglobales archaeon]
MRALQRIHLIVLISIFVVQIMGACGTQGLLCLLPYFKYQWGLKEVEVGVLTSLMYTGVVSFSIIGGQLTDHFGEKRLMFCGVLFIGFMLFFLSFANSYVIALITFFLLGVGYSTINPSTNKAIMVWFPHVVRGTAMGLKQTGVTIGSAIAATILPIMATNFSLRISLQIESIIVMTGALVFYIIYPEMSKQKLPDRVKLQISPNFRYLAINKSIFLVSLIMTLFIAVQFSFGTFLVIELVEVFNFPKIVAAQYLAIAFIAGTIGRVSWGLISDLVFRGSRKTTLNLITIIIAFTTASFAYISLLSEVSWWIIFPVAVLGFSAMGFNAVYLTFVSELAGKNQTGKATGFTLSFAFLGAILGPPLFGFLFQTSGTYFVPWLLLTIFMILCFIGLRVVRE